MLGRWLGLARGVASGGVALSPAEVEREVEATAAAMRQVVEAVLGGRGDG